MLEAKATGQEFLELQPSIEEGRLVPDLRRLDTDVSVVESVMVADNEQEFE